MRSFDRSALASIFVLFTALLIQSCSSDAQKDVQVAFAARLNGQAVNCSDTYTGIGTPANSITFQDFRLFVSNLALIDDQGQEVALELEQDGLWQNQNVALLDFEDATGLCAESGTAETNTIVRGTVPEGTYQGIRFDVGVPFELNHQDAATAESPFNLTSLQWSWQAGYKFIRIDMINENTAPNNKWYIHLGSTGCVSDGSTTPPSTECTKSNRLSYSFAQFDADTQTVVIDVAALLEDVDVGSNTTDSPPGCMCAPSDEADCAPLFQNFGLTWATGVCDGCPNQDFISVE